MDIQTDNKLTHIRIYIYHEISSEHPSVGLASLAQLQFIELAAIAFLLMTSASAGLISIDCLLGAEIDVSICGDSTCIMC